MKYDLHIHSNLSDGLLDKKRIVALAKENKLGVISITDHNDFNSLQTDIPIINGIEFDCFDQISFHLLVYFRNFTNDIKGLINTYKSSVTETSLKTIAKIKEVYGIDVNIDTYPITKRTIIDYLVDKGYASSVTDANRRFTGKLSPSYVRKYSLDFEKLCELDKDNTTLVLAHPTSLYLTKEELESFIKRLKEKGLDGLEVYNAAKSSSNSISILIDIANRYNLITSSGSDFHKPGDILGVENDFSKQLIRKYI